MKPSSGTSIIPVITLDDDEQQNDHHENISKTNANNANDSTLSKEKPQKRCAEVNVKTAKKAMLNTGEARKNTTRTCNESTQPQTSGEVMSFSNLKCCFECEKKLDIDENKRKKFTEAGEIVAVAVEFVTTCNESCLELLRKHQKAVVTATDILQQLIKSCRKLKKLEAPVSTDIKHGLLFAVALCHENVESISKELIAEDVCELMIYLTSNGTRDQQRTPEANTEQWMKMALEAVDVARFHSYLKSSGWKMKIEQEVKDQTLSDGKSASKTPLENVRVVNLEDEIQVLDLDTGLKTTSTQVVTAKDKITTSEKPIGADCAPTDKSNAVNGAPVALRSTSSTQSSAGTSTTAHVNDRTMLCARRVVEENAHNYLQTRLMNNLVQLLQPPFTQRYSTNVANNIMPVRFSVPGPVINAGSSVATVSNANNFKSFVFGGTNPYLDVGQSSSATDNNNFAGSSVVQIRATSNETNCASNPLNMLNSAGFLPLYTDFSSPRKNRKVINCNSGCLKITINKDYQGMVGMTPASPIKSFAAKLAFKERWSKRFTKIPDRAPEYKLPGFWTPPTADVPKPPVASTVSLVTPAQPVQQPENVISDDEVIKAVPSASSGSVDSPIVIDDSVQAAPNVITTPSQENLITAPISLNCNLVINSTVPRPLTLPRILRPIAIDGSNVAYSHGKEVKFSCKGIQLCIDYFFRRGHTVVKVFVPHYRTTAMSNIPVSDRDFLRKLQHKQIVVFTPSRTIDGKLVVCYDDRFLLDYASQSGAIVVSNDNFRDLLKEPRFVDIIKYRLLMYAFADDVFMIPDDPLGKFGPRIDQYLSF